MKWIKRPDDAWVLKCENLVAVLELPGPDYLPLDNRYDLKVIDTEPGPMQGVIAEAPNRTLAEGKDYAEEIIRDYLSDI